MKVNYITLGTNDRAKAEKFYDALFTETAFEKIYSEDRMTMWVNDGFMFALAEPFDGNSASIGNGSMVGLQMPKDDDVDRMHALAISMGGIDEGEPQIRDKHQSAYVRDLDGNKLCFYA